MNPARGSHGDAGRWPASDAVVAFVLAFVLAGLGASLLTAMPGATEDGGLRPIGAQLATVWQAIAFVGVPIALASRFGRPTFEDFGFVAVDPRRLLGVTTGAFVAFLLFSAVWSALVGSDGSQDTLSRFGADEDVGLRVGAALLVIVVAPVVEEVLFRGFMYRCVRNAFGALVGALTIGVIFGLIHLTDSQSAPLVPLLAVLGALMCVVYERTGSLLVPIALHVVNNTVGFAAARDVPDAAALGVPIGIGMLAVLVVVARVVPQHGVVSGHSYSRGGR